MAALPYFWIFSFIRAIRVIRVLFYSVT